jgi:glycosyltransferase involved in cell wall biosynthesis
VRVAAVFWGSEPAEGGGHTFGESLSRALRGIAPESRHEFVYYMAGARDTTLPDVHRIPSSLFARYLRAATYLVRDVLDYTGLPRQRLRTWFERSLADERVDVVWFATTYAERCDQPFVFTVFDVEHARQPWFPEVGALGEWERRDRHFSRYIRKATRVIVPNEAGRGQIVHHFRVNPERVLCLPHPTPAFARAAGQREPMPRARVDALGIRGRYLLYPAQFWAHKNHATLFESVAGLAEEDREPYELVLVGSDKGGQLVHVHSLARAAGIGELVHFLGFVETNDLVALYQHAHALTYLSFFGPENLPPLEAFALGCPVVAADVPGAREQLGDAALLVPPTEPALVAEAVRRLEEPVFRTRLIELGRQRAAMRTPEAYVRGVVSFLDEFEPTRRSWA